MELVAQLDDAGTRSADAVARLWRAGELFPIDVGDGTTLEERGGDWNTFAQKYIGSLNECYRMSLKWLCMFANSDNGMHGDEKYEACMSSHFGASFCPPNNPFPCVTGCNRSYQACPHLPPRKLSPPAKRLALAWT